MPKILYFNSFSLLNYKICRLCQPKTYLIFYLIPMELQMFLQEPHLFLTFSETIHAYFE